MLVQMIAPGVNPGTGAATPGDGWEYEFAEPVAGGFRFHYWRVADNGQVSFYLDIIEPRHLVLKEIASLITVDSDEAARLVLVNGGQDYVDRYPQTHLQMVCRSIGGRVVWDTELWGAPPSDRCSIAIVIDAETAELVYRDTSCLNP